LKFKSDDELREIARVEHAEILSQSEKAELRASARCAHNELLQDYDGDDNAPDFEEGLYGNWRGFQRVGQGTVTNGAETGKRACGGYFGVDFCEHVHLHDFVDLYGVNHKGKTSWVKRFRSCDKFTCPVCYKRASQRQARHVAERIEVLERELGMKAEHIIWSCVADDYALPFVKLLAKMRRDLKACGVIGGYEIFHMERFASWYEAKVKGLPAGWRISLHFHIIGFIEGGYDRCRGCHKSKVEFLKCSGFDGRARRVHFGYVDSHGRKHDGDGAIIKVKAERKTIWGTAYYQLNHCTIRIGVKRQNVGRWFGVAGKRKLKLKNEDRFRYRCPICQYDMVHGQFLGEGSVDGGEWWLREGESDYLDSRGVPQFVKVEKYG
jgi:hypothetical protein